NSTLALTPSTGGVSLANIINPGYSGGTGTYLIDSQNTSGTNTLSGASFLDYNLTVQQAGTSASGALLFQGGSVDFKTSTLTVQGSGTTTLNEQLNSSTSSS